MKKKNPDQEIIDFGKEKIDTSIIIEFPLLLKNKKETLFWRYHIDGKYELISFNKNKNGASFTFDENKLWMDSEKLFDKVFMIRQLQNNILITEEEFVNKMQDFFNLHQKFIGQDSNDIITNDIVNKGDF